MSDEFASFRELRGIGPAIEARLHRAGVRSWQSLSDVLSALNGVRGRNGDTLRELAELAAARAAAPSGEPLADVEPLPDAGGGAGGGEEHSESFLVRIALSAAGVPSRTSVTRVRTQTTRSHTGWSPDGVVGFIDAVVHRLTASVPGPGEPRAGDPGPGDGAVPLTQDPEPGAAGSVPAAPVRPVPEPPVRPVPEPPVPAVPVPDRHHEVVLPVETVVGGGEREFTATVSTVALPAGEGFGYEAWLYARPLGHPDAGPRAGTELAHGTGRGRAPDPVVVAFPPVTVPGGIQRVRLLLSLRLGRPVPGPLDLHLDLASR